MELSRYQHSEWQERRDAERTVFEEFRKYRNAGHVVGSRDLDRMAGIGWFRLFECDLD